MRYTVRYWDGKNIINDLFTNDYNAVVDRVIVLRKKYPSDDVWYADAIIEMLVG